MSDQETPIHISEQDVRAGDTPHVVRYVLAVSLALIIIAFALIFMR
jgi:hypothetical protein